jgi:RNA polymerase sigma-70 factor (ECF subfamily)
MIELRYYEELSYEEIATELDIPLGTVKAQLFRAKEMLYTLMQKPGHAAYLESTRRYN